MCGHVHTADVLFVTEMRLGVAVMTVSSCVLCGTEATGFHS